MGKKSRVMVYIDMGNAWESNETLKVYRDFAEGAGSKGVRSPSRLWLYCETIGDEELAKSLEPINRVLRDLGEPEVSLDCK
jgi:hypothetical protein